MGVLYIFRELRDMEDIIKKQILNQRHIFIEKYKVNILNIKSIGFYKNNIQLLESISNVIMTFDYNQRMLSIQEKNRI